MKSSDERLIDWVFDSPAPHAVEISKWKYEGSTTFSLLIEGARGLKKSRKRNSEEPPSQPANWQVNNQTQQPNEHFDSSNIFKEIQRDTYYRTSNRTSYIEHFNPTSSEHRTKARERERTRANKQRTLLENLFISWTNEFIE